LIVESEAGSASEDAAITSPIVLMNTFEEFPWIVVARPILLPGTPVIPFTFVRPTPDACPVMAPIPLIVPPWKIMSEKLEPVPLTKTWAEPLSRVTVPPAATETAPPAATLAAPTEFIVMKAGENIAIAAGEVTVFISKRQLLTPETGRAPNLMLFVAGIAEVPSYSTPNEFT
jgi:hypothetical protein